MFLRNTWCSTGNIPNIIWHWSVTNRDLVRKIFIKTRVTAKDTELWSRARNGQASVAHKSTGRHFEDINCIMTLSDATLPNIALKDCNIWIWQAQKYTWTTEHCKINTQINICTYRPIVALRHYRYCVALYIFIFIRQ